MKVLILTGRFGMGHVRCAEALSEIIEKRNPNADVYVVDLIDHLVHSLKHIAYNFYKLEITKLAPIYNYLTKATGENCNVPFKKIAAGRILKLTEKYKPDLVISTFPLCGQYFAAYKKLRNDPVPMYTYITDITSHKEWIADGTDLYFTADETTKESLVSEGISPLKIHITGIPVSESFRKESEDIIPRPKKHILVTGGGVGHIPGRNKLLKTLSSLDDADITLVCGNNRTLKKTAEEKYPTIHTVGFTDKMPEIMKNSDIIITKPGGITVFEAIKSRTPLFLIRPDLEQEMENAAFVEKYGLGIIHDSDEKLIGYIYDNRLLEDIKENMRKVSESFEDEDPITYFQCEGGRKLETL